MPRVFIVFRLPFFALFSLLLVAFEFELHFECNCHIVIVSGKAKLWPSFFSTLGEALRSPVQYVMSPQFRWIWLVYGGTYLAANVTDTTCAATNTNPAMPKWLATSFVNTVTCIGMQPWCSYNCISFLSCQCIVSDGCD
jgi:hypothetical protein